MGECLPTDKASGAVDRKLLLTPRSKEIYLVFHSNKSCFREGYVDAVLLSIGFPSLTVRKKLNPVLQFSKAAAD